MRSGSDWCDVDPTGRLPVTHVGPESSKEKSLDDESFNTRQHFALNSLGLTLESLQAAPLALSKCFVKLVILERIKR